MKKLQSSALVKLTAVLLLVALSFTAGLQGIRFLSGLPYLNCDSYQDTGRFQYLLREKQNDVASGVAYYLRLEQGDLTYPDRKIMEDLLQELRASTEEDNTWFRFRLMTADGSQVLYTNLEEHESLAGWVEAVHYSTFVAGEHLVSQRADSDFYAGWMQEEGLSFAPSSVPEGEPAPAKDPKVSILTEQTTLVIECGVLSAEAMAAARNNLMSVMDPDGAGPLDEFERLAEEHKRAVDNAEVLLTTAGVAAALALICLLFLLWTAGHRTGEEKPVPFWQDCIFLEPYAVVMVGLGLLMVGGLVEVANFYSTYHYSAVVYGEEIHRLMLWGGAALAAGLTAAAGLLLRTLIVRLKTGTLVRSTLILRLLGWLWQGGKAFVSALPLTWKLLILSALYLLITIMFYLDGRYNGFWCFLWFLASAVAVGGLCWWVVSFSLLRKGSRAIAAGELEYRIDTRRMPLDLKDTAEHLNNISAGLSAAVDEKMKSERFKAELITNVSHDLKTPLTSIINYVDLLKTTDQPDAKAREYIDVLDRKSQRLKKLTEDLVEASKASTGVLNISREKISLPQLLDQALGEWSEKLEARNLSLVTSLPEGDVAVYADGRHLWRVLDNLLSNCSKYAMEGTRVYLDLVRGKGQVVLSVKNISREPLNVPPERLMERFVRGDESRTTEGSGLGLSIARSLTELQGGTFQLAVDGDLFKAIVTLPQAN